jgi:nucleoside phosphorylase
VKREASVLRGLGVDAIAIGGSGAALDAALVAHVGEFDSIISFGMGGALGPDLKLGDWVIGSSVISSTSPSGEGLGWGLSGSCDLAAKRQTPPPTPPLKGRGFQSACDQHLIDSLEHRIPRARIGSVYADGRLIGDSCEKQSLFRKHGALVADMESHLVAKSAARIGSPFGILRCISDEAGADLPPAIAVAMHPDGSLALGSILKSILTNPAQMPELMRSTARFNRAFASLECGAKLAFSQP